MELSYVMLIIIIHWVADFVMQDEEWALNKSKSDRALLKHTTTYSIIWFFALIPFPELDWTGMVLFTLITFTAHTLTDYFTSVWVSKKFEKGELGSSVPNLGAFTYIGADQVLHYVQLLVTFKIIF